MKIPNSKVLITGSNRGIGLALAKEMAKRKAHLHLQMRTEAPELADELKKLGAPSVKFWLFDLGDRAQIEKWLVSLQKEELDILINNAGTGCMDRIPLQQAATVDFDVLHEAFETNFFGTIRATKVRESFLFREIRN